MPVFFFWSKNMLKIKQKQNFSFLRIGIVLFLFFPLQTVFASEITPDKVIELVNGARLAENVGMLTKDETLMRVARMKADDMFEKGYFAHNSPEGKTPWTWFDKAGYAYEYAGENLAIHFVRAEEQQRAWMDSPTHRKNILNPEYLEIGVAVRRGFFDGKETTVTVQEFGRREKSVAAFSTGAITEKGARQEQSVISSQAVSVSNDATNRVYERLLTVVWIVMTVQAFVLGYGIRRASLRARNKNAVVHVLVKNVRERAYRIPVTVFGEK